MSVVLPLAELEPLMATDPSFELSARRIFVYEHISAGGIGTAHGPTPKSLLAEGTAMLAALTMDLCSARAQVATIVQHCFVSSVALPLKSEVTIIDREPSEAIRKLAAASDVTIAIAPESQAALLQCYDLVLSAGGRLLGLNKADLCVTSDKHRTCKLLERHGVPTPFGIALKPGEYLPADFPYPGVLKPRDGAGSQHTSRVEAPHASTTRVELPARLEAYCPGIPASVAFLCGPRGSVPLLPCIQDIDSTAGFAYRGGSILPSPELAERAVALASRAIKLLDHPLGYVGVDLILGDLDDGSADVVLEINPRLTTSYVGLRHAYDTNLAAAMVLIAEGLDLPLRCSPQPLRWAADGLVTGLT
jgi:predicted ATP-grasp superfamily ATP-dependent carboligase